jgi:hypothetical protein
MFYVKWCEIMTLKSQSVSPFLMFLSGVCVSLASRESLLIITLACSFLCWCAKWVQKWANSGPKVSYQSLLQWNKEYLCLRVHTVETVTSNRVTFICWVSHICVAQKFGRLKIFGWCAYSTDETGYKKVVGTQFLTFLYRSLLYPFNRI